ncbi:hypothetical protein ACU635_51045 [[Actinomadura] parvosata]|uniref:hypothetical protein n=1 Tax=[Actinomadura] parvosata TaxID=1955412 RepID=UPI00406D2602
MPRKNRQAQTDRLIRDARKADNRGDLIDTLCHIAEDIAPEVAEDLQNGGAE